MITRESSTAFPIIFPSDSNPTFNGHHPGLSKREYFAAHSNISLADVTKMMGAMAITNARPIELIQKMVELKYIEELILCCGNVKSKEYSV